MKYKAKYWVFIGGGKFVVSDCSSLEITYEGECVVVCQACVFAFGEEKNAKAFAQKMNAAKWNCLNNMEQPGGIIIDKDGNVHEPVEVQPTDDPARDFLADLCEACSLRNRKECAFAKCREKVRSNGNFYYAKRKKQK